MTLLPDAGRLCVGISTSRIGAPTAAHLHAGTYGSVGPVVADVTATVLDGRRCLKLSPGLLLDIRRHPGGYYVDVHTLGYPRGAIRGQLRR
jgi:hypothetical protein